MARLLSLSRHFPPLKTLSTRSYISEMRHSAFKNNLLRLLRSEIDFELESRPPSPPHNSFRPFSIENNPGSQWVQLISSHGPEEIKIDASMFDGAAPSSKTDSEDPNTRLHISLVVQVSKGDSSEFDLQFVCSAWPDGLDVENVFPVRRGSAAVKPYMGPDFKELDKEMQEAVYEYLESRGVGDELAGFLHEYMENKDKMELVRWLRNVEGYVKKK